MNQQYIGSNFDDFLKEEGILEETGQTARDRVNDYAADKNPTAFTALDSENFAAYSYKGYTGVATFDADTGVFNGEVTNMRDVITFEGASAEEVEQAFIDSIEDYLDFIAAPPSK